MISISKMDPPFFGGGGIQSKTLTNDSLNLNSSHLLSFCCQYVLIYFFISSYLSALEETSKHGHTGRPFL